MKTKFAGLTAAALLAASLSTPASAAFISGTLGFSNGLDAPLGDIVSDLTLFTIGAPTNASGGTGDFLGVSGLTTTSNIDIGAPAGVIYSVGGFSFTLTGINSVVSDPISCAGGLCTDEKAFQIVGSVSAAGFDSSGFIGNFTANGTCLEEGATGACQAGSRSATWSSTVVALGRAETPVPATLALLGLALAGLGWTRRSKS